MVEIIVAMFVLALMSIGLLPMLLGAVRTTQSNRELAAATTLAGASLDDARQAAELSSTCAALTTWKTEVTTSDPVDGNVAEATVGRCPTSFPGTIDVSVRVYPQTDPDRTLAALSTKIVVDST
nr:hypothetical protein [Propionicicella superfundia]